VKIEKGLERQRAKDVGLLNKIQNQIADHLSSRGITDCTVFGRVKHLYSIYRKMYGQNKELAEVLDLYAFRVIVNTIGDCYNVLGYIHELFNPLPGKFKDYISTPKPNDYQSLHTSVIGTDGVPFEVQIRTWAMHETAEYGIAAHWKYKEGKSKSDANEEKFAWVRRQLESQQDSDAQDFFQSLKTDMFSDEVFVYTPNGDVVNLPTGSTPIDFAYSIHSAIGNSMTGAMVNKRMVPFTHVLQNGDIVEILTSKSSKGPSRDWLKIIKSAEARNKIRQWFKKEKREENIIHGKLMFEEELRRANIKPEEILREGDMLIKAISRASFKSLDDMYAAIGYGGVSAQKTVNKIRDELRAAAAKTKQKEEKEEAQKKPEPRPTHVKEGVMVEGMGGCLVKFARCCSPVPGDQIVGFTTRGFGVSVHRQDCENYIKRVPVEADRWVNVSWADTEGKLYATTIQVAARDRAGLIADIATSVNTLNIKMGSFNARYRHDDGSVYTSVDVEVKSKDELVLAMAKIKGVSGVSDVTR
jgi:GTP pyrophosphokinase